MFCVKCGAKIPDGAKFCGICGNPMPAASEANAGAAQPERETPQDAGPGTGYAGGSYAADGQSGYSSVKGKEMRIGRGFGITAGVLAFCAVGLYVLVMIVAGVG